jgi:hypothetical protein
MHGTMGANRKRKDGKSPKPSRNPYPVHRITYLTNQNVKPLHKSHKILFFITFSFFRRINNVQGMPRNNV